MRTSEPGSSNTRSSAGQTAGRDSNPFENQNRFVSMRPVDVEAGASGWPTRGISQLQHEATSWRLQICPGLKAVFHQQLPRRKRLAMHALRKPPTSPQLGAFRCADS